MLCIPLTERSLFFFYLHYLYIVINDLGISKLHSVTISLPSTITDFDTNVKDIWQVRMIIVVAIIKFCHMCYLSMVLECSNSFIR